MGKPRPMPDNHPVDIVVQRVRTWWTIRSRGAPAATVRNAAPSAFTLPQDFTFGMHEVVMDERDGFQPQTRQADLHDPGLPLRIVDGALRVRPPKLPGMGSAPRRNRRPPAVHLAGGQWVRWQINYRLVGSNGGPSHYRLDTFNVHFGSPSSPDVFLGMATYQVEELGYVR